MAKKKTVKPKKATRPAKKVTKGAKKKVKRPNAGTMPQKSAASKKGGARPIGNHSGVGVIATWIGIFEQNAKAAKKNRMTDAEITKEMNRNFPGRNSAVFKNVTGVRSAMFREGKLDHINPVERYDENGDVIEKGKRLAGERPTKGVKAKRPVKKAKKAKRPAKKR